MPIQIILKAIRDKSELAKRHNEQMNYSYAQPTFPPNGNDLERRREEEEPHQYDEQQQWVYDPDNYGERDRRSEEQQQQDFVQGWVRVVDGHLIEFIDSTRMKILMRISLASMSLRLEQIHQLRLSHSSRSSKLSHNRM